MKRLLMGIALLLMLPLAGCVTTSGYMAPSVATAAMPQAGKAMVVFMRPSNYGGAIQASVYDATRPAQEFIGIVSGNTKIAYQADPGKHLFMVVGENADFLNATLDAGKTYYVLVSPRMGMWKARFSLLPIHNDPAAKYSTRSADFAKWQAGTRWVQKTPAADAWYLDNAANVTSKRADYMQRWNTASAEQQAELTLLPGDGT
ncbi:hypothetical protein [Cognatiluteimonas profundi]|uniref:hypothetical protein n=1 Tax=Cognatiluteimonas profundi TaxID=2594501 RepID=UPI00131DB9BA|nr:hypothetical protein [Lysobacter profundi]